MIKSVRVGYRTGKRPLGRPRARSDKTHDKGVQWRALGGGERRRENLFV